jgi:hypothetical protein
MRLMSHRTWLVPLGLLVLSGCNCGDGLLRDAGVDDAGSDSGVGDGGPPDGGQEDAGADDGGTDAGLRPSEMSDFASGDEGWAIAGDAQATSAKPTYDSDGGFIGAKDDVTGGVWYFVAPERYLGDNRAFIGRWLEFDLRVAATPTNPFNAADVRLINDAGTVLAYDTPTNPVDSAWTTYAVPLSAAGWKVGSLDGPDATDAGFEDVMGRLTGLWIRGEFNTGADTGYLDNVLWGVTA